MNEFSENLLALVLSLLKALPLNLTCLKISLVLDKF